VFKIEGLDKLNNDLENAAQALGELDGELGRVSFDPNDPASIDQAIRSVNSMIDERVSGFEDNPIIEPLVEEMKATYRQAILDKAAAARLGSNEEDE